jgi:serine/threonine protein kinase
VQEVQTILPTGSVVGDRYVVEDLLGKGGFGAVYLVRDQRVKHNLFALKEVIDPNKRERDRFAFEGEVLRRLDHPALPRVYRIFKDDVHDRAYMLMDYVEGPNLEILRHQQPDNRLPLPQVMRIMGPIMNAVSYLHGQHPPIIHRDIKPANIIVPTSGDDAVLVDFGIAKEYDPDSTTTAIRHCSPGYGAPEQYGIGTNTRTDIYGLGATMYAVLTGVVPADAFYRTTQLGSKGIDPLEPLNSLVPNVPPHVADAIARAMVIDSNERFPTVNDFWQALNAHPLEQPQPQPVPVVLPVAASRPAVITRPRPPIEDATTANIAQEPTSPAPRSRRRRLGLLLLLLAFLLALISASALFLAFMGHHPTTVTQPPAPTVRQLPTLTPSPRVTPRPTSTSPGTSPGPVSSIPGLAPSYSGSIHNNGGVDASMGLNSIKQNGSNFSGYFTVGPQLLGSGPFTGTINAKGQLQFTVQGYEGNAPLFFTGSIQASTGNLSGTYCSLDNTGHCNPAAGGSGTWRVTPILPGSGSGSSSSSFVPSGSSSILSESKILRREQITHLNE